MPQIFAKQPAALRSVWVQALLWGGALLGYHFLMAAINPKTGAIDRATFPLYGIADPVLTGWVIGPILTFIGWLMTLLWFWRRKSQTVPLIVALAFVVALNVTTAMVRGGMPALSRPFDRIGPEAKLEYFADINRVSDPVTFVRNYRKLVPTLSLHSTTHPPGPVLYLWAVSRVFGEDIAVAAWAAIIGTALSIYPFSLLARTVLSPAASWYAIAMYAVSPALVWFGATSMDGVFVFFPLLATYFFHESWSQNPVRYSILTGLALAASMFFTFMTVCIGFVFALEAALSSRATANSRRIWRNLVYAGLTFAVVHWLLFMLTNYNVIRAFNLARQAASAYRLELYPDIWHYLSVSSANLAAFLIGVGVITVALWWREIAEGWRAWGARRSTDLLTMALSAAVLLLAFATIFCVETERVWLFLAPLPILAAARHLDRLQSANPQAMAWCVVLTLLFGQTLVIQSVVHIPW